MKIGEIFNLRSYDIQERYLTIQNPINGRTEEALYVPQKLLVRLTSFIKSCDIRYVLPPIVWGNGRDYFSPLTATVVTLSFGIVEKFRPSMWQY